MKYRKKPLIVEAEQWTGTKESFSDCCDFCPLLLNETYRGGDWLSIPTSEGKMRCNLGDYIIKEPFDKERKFYPCKPDIFEKTYEKVEE